VGVPPPPPGDPRAESLADWTPAMKPWIYE
jgi:hypothetical protein